MLKMLREEYKNLFKAHINGEKVQSCKEHCVNTANYAKHCTESIGIGNIAYLCGLLHDAGKCTEEFNEYIEAAADGKEVVKGSVIHTFAGLKMILSKYHSYYNPDVSSSAFGDLTAELVAIAIGSHHGQFDIYNEKRESGYEHRFKKQPEYDKKAAENYYKECATETEIDTLYRKSESEIEQIYYKIITLIDETADKNIEELLFYLATLERFLLSTLIEGDRRDTAEFMSDNKIKFPDMDIDKLTSIWQDSLGHLLQKLDAFPQDTELQCARRELSDYCEDFAKNPCGIYRLNFPTGAGKTLSGLRYALAHAKEYQKKRIIFAIPLLSILDQNAKVIRDAVENDSLILEHHSNVVQEGSTEEEKTQREILVDTWDSPIIITTLVQLLNTMFDGKTSAIRRFHSLANSVVVIDEVQSVPTKMLSLFNLTLNFLSKICNTTFLLCSATQPLLELNEHRLLIDKAEAVPVEEMQTYKSIFKRTDVQYIGELDYDEIMERAGEYYSEYNSVLIVCNTKKEACELFKKAKAITENCIHLSTSMCMAHRKAVIAEMSQKLKDKELLICVSTQLIEAGVDVSFGAVIRLAAGIDNVAQAAGRGNRNGESENLCPVGIAFLKNENLSRLKEIKQSQDVTGELIQEYKNRPDDFENDLISDASVNYYYEALFRKINSTKNYTNFCVRDGNIFDFLSYNKYAENSPTQITMRQAFKTAGEKFEVFNDAQISLIVPFGDGADIINDILSDRFAMDIMWAKNVLKDAKEYIVNVYDYQLKKLNEDGAIYADKNQTVFILNRDYYDSQLGVLTEKGEDEAWDTLIL